MRGERREGREEKREVRKVGGGVREMRWAGGDGWTEEMGERFA